MRCQEAGAPLGLAAPYLYSLPAGAVTDIVPVGSKTNVTASIQEPSTTNVYNPSAVLGGAVSGKFVSALWDFPALQDTALAISFGTNCDASGFFATPCNSPSALHTKPSWDNVTGVGTPNGKAFADSFKRLSSKLGITKKGPAPHQRPGPFFCTPVTDQDASKYSDQPLTLLAGTRLGLSPFCFDGKRESHFRRR